MAIEITEVRKSISFSYDSEAVRGDKATVSAKNPDTDEELSEKKTVPNDGSAALAFPLDYSGTCEVLVEGSDGGSDEGELEIL